MNSSRSVATMIAIALMLAPASIGTFIGGYSDSIVLANGKPAYPPCAFAPKGKICYGGHGLVSGGGRGGWRRR